MADNKPSISLTIQLPDGTTKVLEFNTHDPIMVGSGASSHVRLDGDEVSSLHCMLKPRDGKVYVLDLGSDDGTELNGKELTGETALEDGDTVTVGKARMTVHFGGDLLAPTVPIRRAAGHGTAIDEATVPLQDAPKVTQIEVEKRLEATKVEKVEKVEKIEKVEKLEKLENLEKAARAETSGKSRRAEISGKSKRAKGGRDSAPAASVDVTAPEGSPEITAPAGLPPPSRAAARPEAPARPSQRDVATEVVRNPVTAAEPRLRQREISQTGFNLGKASSHDGYRKMNETQGQAAVLAPNLSKEFKATDKRGVDVTAMWGGTVLGVMRLKDGKGEVTIGDSETALFRLSHPSIPSPNFALVTLGGTGATIHVASNMEAEVDGKPASGNIQLENGQRAVVRVGPIEFFVQYTKKAPLALVGFGEFLDVFYTKILAMALIFQVGIITAMLLTPVLPSLDDDDLFKNQADFTKLILTAQEKKKEKKEDLSGKKADRRKDDEGTFGKKDKPKEDKVASKKGAPTVDKDKREEDRKIAMDALAALGLKGPEGAVSNVFGPGGLGTGVNNALGGLKGASMGDAGGAGGLGSRGTGAGGGGTGLGIGGLGSGTGRGSGGSGNIDLGGKGKGMTRIVPGKVIYEGGLSREEIQRVISRVMSQIKYCYEKELNKDPNLEGKLVMFWIISGSGDVQTVQTTQNTFGGASAAPIDQCVSRIIQRLKFSTPKGGGIVNVTYPFVFSSSGR